MTWLRRLLGLDRALMSDTWRSEQGRREQRIEFHGVAISWPVRKIVNESAAFNTRKLRRTA